MGLFEQIAAGLTLAAQTAARVRPEFEKLSTAAADAESKVTSAMRRAQAEAKATSEAIHGISSEGTALGDLASEIESSIGRP